MDKVSKISKEENSRNMKLKEAAFIHCIHHVISQPSNDISPIRLSIIRPEIKRKKLRRETQNDITSSDFRSLDVDTLASLENTLKIDNNPRPTCVLVVRVPDQ